ncbi:MAG: hypothetical protein ACTSXX_09990 [Candidatus Baldrarchaeia archaeon]
MSSIVPNSSILIALSKLRLLSVLTKLFDKVIIPGSVYEEVVVRGAGRPGAEEVKELCREFNVLIMRASNKKLVEALHDPLG